MSMRQSKKTKTVKGRQVHLLGHALNILCEKKIIDLDKVDKIEPGHLECMLFDKQAVILWADIGCGEIRLSVWWNYDKHHHPQHLEGGYRDKIVTDDMSQDEYRSLWKKTTKSQRISKSEVEKYRTSQPLAKRSKYKDFVGVVCSCWVKRQTEAVQLPGGSSLENTYARASDKQALQMIPDCVPNGFEIPGEFLS